jgi:type I restriction enzyme S subunit
MTHGHALPFGVPHDWRVADLTECCEFIKDGDWIETKDQGGSTYRLLQISNVGVGRFVETGNYRWITEETFKRLRCTEILDGDVLVARMPEPTGRTWFVQSLPWKAVTAVDVAILRTRSEELNARFLSYYLNSPAALALTESLTIGTTRSRIRRSDIERFPVPQPTIQEQRRITGVLGALDNKIEANTKLCARLDALARLRFSQWFAKWEGVASIRVGDEIAAGTLVVGDGYRAKNSELESTGVPFVRGRNVGEDDVDVASAELLGFNGVRLAGEKLSRRGDAFFTAKGTVGRIGRVSRWTPQFVYSPQIAYWRVLDEDLVLADFVYMWLRGREFLAQRDAVKGQTDMADYVNLRDQREMRMSLPPIDEQVQAFRLLTPLLDLIALTRTESRRLADLRNALLPRLVSGAIRVPEDYEPRDLKFAS